MKYLTAVLAMTALSASSTVSAQSFDKLLRNVNNGLGLISGTRATSNSTSPPKAERVSSGPSFGSIAKADIAGVRLGMTPDQAQAALTAMGYTIVHRARTKAFEQTVLMKAAARNPKIKAPSYSAEDATREISASGPSNERIDVIFLSMPEGSVAVSIRLSIDTSKVTRASFEKAMYSKYGAHTDAQDGMRWYYWCDAGTVKCAYETGSGKYPYMQYTAWPALVALELSAEGVQSTRQQALIAAKVDKLAPMQRATF